METYGEICKFLAIKYEGKNIFIILSKDSAIFAPAILEIEFCAYRTTRWRGIDRDELVFEMDDDYKTTLLKDFFLINNPQPIRNVDENSKILPTFITRARRILNHFRRKSINDAFNSTPVQNSASPKIRNTRKKLGLSRQRNPLRHAWQKARGGWKWSTRVAARIGRYSSRSWIYQNGRLTIIRLS